MSVLARFYVSEITRTAYNAGSCKVTLQASTRGKENASWSKYTPHGNLEMTILNPDASRWFEERLGKDVVLSFSEVDDATYATPHTETPNP